MPRIQLNEVILAGNLTDTPVLKEINDKTKVCNATIVVNKRLPGEENGKPRERQIYTDISAWNETAERLAQRVKGDNILVMGELDLETWGEGEAKKRKHKVNVNLVRFIFGKETASADTPADAGEALG